MSPRSKPTSAERTQAILDQFYKERGPCCAGCDWWRWQTKPSDNLQSEWAHALMINPPA